MTGSVGETSTRAAPARNPAAPAVETKHTRPKEAAIEQSRDGVFTGDVIYNKSCSQRQSEGSAVQRQISSKIPSIGF
jgi:hypothetical protein